MSINNMSDEELDNLFRKSAESFDPPFDPEAWTAMEKKLDQVQGWQRLLRYFFPLFIMTVLLSGVLSVTKLNKEPEQLSKGQVNGVPLVDYQERKLNEQFISGGKVLIASEENKEIDSMENGINKALNMNSRNPAYATATKPQADRARLSLTDTTTPFLFSQTNIPTAVLQAASEGKKTESSALEQVALPAVMAIQDTMQLFPDKLQSEAVVTDTSRQERTSRKNNFLRNLQLSVLFAPDITTVRFKNPEAVSANTGLLIGIPLTNRISIISGAIWANKTYVAAPEDYAPSPDYWNSRKLPSSIDARCKVLDIPLNIRYKILEWNKNMLAVQAGLSSYIMLEEKYTYNYQTNGYDTYSKTKKFKHENEHWFGVQNMSVSYTRHLSPAFSLTAEPFVKIPLSSIGEGYVKLTSAGVFFTANYLIHLRK